MMNKWMNGNKRSHIHKAAIADKDREEDSGRSVEEEQTHPTFWVVLPDFEIWPHIPFDEASMQRLAQLGRGGNSMFWKCQMKYTTLL